jgi:flagellar biosynthesis protein
VEGRPLRKAVALRYDPQQESAPVLLAKGQGYVAERIIERAKEHGIAVQEDAGLVALLLQVELDQQVPPQLFAAVAKVLGAVYRVNRRLARERGILP